MGKLKTEMTMAEEMAGRKTGYQILVENKSANLRATTKLLKEKKTATEIASILRVSLRTAKRYISQIKESYNDGFFGKNSVEMEIAEKEKRKNKARVLLRQHPEMSRRELAAQVGVSKRTLTLYLAELRAEK